MAAAPPDPTITCPHCSRAIPLTQALAAPLIAAARRDATAEVEQRERALAAREEELRRAKAGVEEQVARRIAEEREGLRKTAREEAAESVAVQLRDLRDQVASKAEALEEARAKELELRKAMRTLKEEQDAWALEKQRQLDAERSAIRDRVLTETEERHRLRDAEKDELINGMKRQIEDLRRKAEQGSQQTQGEVQELDLEATLRAAFPTDLVEPVAKGVRGADCLHRVLGPGGAAAGSILWESKRTKNWSDAWLAKLREDQREARADAAILVSSVLPRGVARFALVDGIWVSDLASAVPLAQALRLGIVETAGARVASAGRETKMGLLYEYLCGPQFRQRVEAIVEAFTTMKEDLERERKALTAAWAKREKQLERALLGTTGMYGDLQGIAGATLPGIAALELPAEAEPGEAGGNGGVGAPVA